MPDQIPPITLPLADAEMIQLALERVASYLDADDMAWSVRNGLGEVRSCSLALEARAAAERMKAHSNEAIVAHYHAEREAQVGPPPIPVGPDELREAADLRFGRQAVALAVDDPVIQQVKQVDDNAEVIE